VTADADLTAAPTTSVAARPSHIPLSGRVPVLADPGLRIDPVVAVRATADGIAVECAS
jgi:hypothetical protein